MARAEIELILSKAEDTAKVVKLLNSIKETVMKRLGLEERDTFFSVTEIVARFANVDFTVSSHKTTNCEWQVERIIIELKQLVEQGDISIVMFDGYMDANMDDADECWSMESQDFIDEFRPTLEPK